MPMDPRRIDQGYEIPSEGYCDQPYVVINPDGSWTCLMTTGQGIEGESGQHVVSTLSRDRGQTWSKLFDIEPASGPEASWVMPLVTDSGRIYAFYTYNSKNLREVKKVNGQMVKRVDSLGVYAYKYSDDQGRTWSESRYEIPMRLFECDKANTYGGDVLFFWGVGKPFIHKGTAYVCASKVGGFGRGFFETNEGVLFRCTNLLTEPDPTQHNWETLPDGEIGMRAPRGPIAGEMNATPMNDGSLYCTYRTIDGFSCAAYSRDDGHTWTPPAYMSYTPGGRLVKNPRAANFVRRFSNGKYLYWFHHHGGEVLGRATGPDADPGGGRGYESRNPVWLAGGVEKDGYIHWSQPEIVLYDDDPGIRISYPDFIEQDGRYYLTETQKEIARVHEIAPELLQGMWDQVSEPVTRNVVPAGLILEAGPDQTTVDMPELPTLINGGGFSMELRVRFETLDPWQMLFDSRNSEGRGITVMLTDRQTLLITLSGNTWGQPGGHRSCGLTSNSWETDPGVIAVGTRHLVFIIDGGPKIISVVVDGVLCDGGSDRQFGWGRFNPCLRDANGAATAKLASSLHGELLLLRLYNRFLRTSEAVMAGACRKNR